MKAAHARRQTFAAEMRDGSTFRAKAARKAIALSMHTRVQYAANVNRLMYDLQQVAA
jgi:hypothetical protein